MHPLCLTSKHDGQVRATAGRKNIQSAWPGPGFNPRSTQTHKPTAMKAPTTNVIVHYTNKVLFECILIDEYFKYL